MKNSLIVILLIFKICNLYPQSSISKYKFWEDLTIQEKKTILSNQNLFKEAKNYYESHAKPYDSMDLTFNLLKKISNAPIKEKNDIFYIHLLDTITSSVEGIIAEFIGINWINFIDKNPSLVVNYLHKRKLDDNYLNFLATYFFEGLICINYKKNKYPFITFKNKLNRAIINESTEVKKTANFFLNLVKQKFDEYEE